MLSDNPVIMEGPDITHGCSSSSVEILSSGPAPSSPSSDSCVEVKCDQSRRYPSRRRVSIDNSSHSSEQCVTPKSKQSSLHAETPCNGDADSELRRKFHSDNGADVPSSDIEIPSWLDNIEIEKCYTVEGKQHEGISAEKKTKEILRIFDIICQNLAEEGTKGGRIEFTALKLFKRRFHFLACETQLLGKVPGIEVGHLFPDRVHLSIVGIHRGLQAGIATIRHGGLTLAASVLSYVGCHYGDIINNSDVLIYTGSGGASGMKIKKDCCPSDQKLVRGNLALKNCIDTKTPVRVIFGFKETGVSKSLNLSKKRYKYVYDGLYQVEKYWSESGGNGFSVFKFQLRRIPGQPELSVKELLTPAGLTTRTGVCIEDLSKGEDKKVIPAVNTIDAEFPMPFVYITKMIHPSWYVPTTPGGCDCVGGCSDAVKCPCVVKNGGEIPFNAEGAIVEAKPLVYECGPSCKCPPSCQNRVSQHGIRFQLEVFKTKMMGWGVRTLEHIPSGGFVCEYIGEMVEEAEAETRANDEYLFDIGKNYHDRTLWEGLKTSIPDLQKNPSTDDTEEGGFTIDAAMLGNIGRFINHNCTPNLYAQNLLYDHDDKSMPHVMLFATEDIAPLTELTYHYNYYIDRVQGPDGSIRTKACYCGSHECTGRLY